MMPLTTAHHNATMPQASKSVPPERGSCLRFCSGSRQTAIQSGTQRGAPLASSHLALPQPCVQAVLDVTSFPAAAQPRLRPARGYPVSRTCCRLPARCPAEQHMRNKTQHNGSQKLREGCLFGSSAIWAFSLANLWICSFSSVWGTSSFRSLLNRFYGLLYWARIRAFWGSQRCFA